MAIFSNRLLAVALTPERANTDTGDIGMILNKYLITAAVALPATALSAAELVTDGDFSAGNTDFATTYSYINYSATAGTYLIDTNASNYCGCWTNLPDQTSGTGNI